MIQITKSGSVFSGSAEDLERLRLQFDQQHWVRLRGLLGPELLQVFRDQIERGQFSERTHEGIGSNKELCLLDHPTAVRLHFVLNGQRLFEIVQNITRCGRIGCYMGRVYRVVPGHGHHDSWHDDLLEHRMIAMSINLSAEIYAGGILQIRDRESKQILHEVANTGFGDAIIFRIARKLQHRITQVHGKVSKTAFAGWFLSQPDFLSSPVGFNRMTEAGRTVSVPASPLSLKDVWQNFTP